MTPLAEILREDRRICLLRSLGCVPERRASHLVLHEVLDSLGHGVSRDQLLADLAWLAEQGLVACDCLKPGGNGCTVATLTPRGLDVALGRAVVPGVKRPLPGDPPDPEAL